MKEFMKIDIHQYTDQSLQYLAQNWEATVGIIILLTIIGIGLGLTKKVVFYRDYNDLGFSLATIGFPAVLGVIFAQTGFLYSDMAPYILIGVFLLLLLRLIWATWSSNPMRPFVATTLIVAKLILSLLYIFYLYQAMAGSKRKDRGAGMFVLAIFTPLLLALVHTQDGSFHLASSGRPSMRR